MSFSKTKGGHGPTRTPLATPMINQCRLSQYSLAHVGEREFMQWPCKEFSLSGHLGIKLRRCNKTSFLNSEEEQACI